MLIWIFPLLARGRYRPPFFFSFGAALGLDARPQNRRPTIQNIKSNLSIELSNPIFPPLERCSARSHCEVYDTDFAAQPGPPQRRIFIA
jgi:hypothetical protein